MSVAPSSPLPRAVPPARRLPGGCLLPAALGLAGPCHAGEAAAAGGTLTEGLIVGGGLFLLLEALTVLTLCAFQGRRRAVELKRAEAERRAREAEAASDRDRRAFEDQRHLLSMMAHEFRTPLAIIDASVQSLRLLDEDATPERLNRFGRIARAVERMNGLLELVQTRDRFDVSVWTQDLAKCDLADVTADALDIVGAHAEQRVVVQSADGVPPLEADHRMLRYALLNLIDNALKYSPRGSRVDVSIKPMQCDGRAGLLWTILDQGRGIAAADRERIFEKYYRSDDTSETAGLGLGLYIVRQIIQRHQGSVRAVVGEPGNGGCFECWLPLAQCPEGGQA